MRASPRAAVALVALIRRAPEVADAKAELLELAYACIEQGRGEEADRVQRCLERMDAVARPSADNEAD